MTTTLLLLTIWATMTGPISTLAAGAALLCVACLNGR